MENGNLASSGVEMNCAYDLSRIVVHNRSVVSDCEDAIWVETPPLQWAYAFTVPPAPLTTGSFPIRTKIEVCVEYGAIGIGSLNQEGKEFVTELKIAGPSGWSEVYIDAVADQHGALVVRNVSSTGEPSRAKIRILGSERKRAPSAERSIINIDPTIVNCFKSWSGRVRKGYWADWTGTLTNAQVWAFPMQALLRAGPNFNMAALGAGWGRWISAGVALARQLGKHAKVVGVEAEPNHFEWMVRHMQENGIGPEDAILINGAAAGKSGECWFHIGDAQSWYGQSIAVMSDSEAFELSTGKLRRTKAVTITDVLNSLSPIDYLHMDIQGAEAEVLEYAPDKLNEFIGMVNVGTHSNEIELRLRKLFQRLDWIPVYDVPLGAIRTIHLESAVVPDVKFGDGVQVWMNKQTLSSNPSRDRRPTSLDR